jgi:hypothetical protein
MFLKIKNTASCLFSLFFVLQDNFLSVKTNICPCFISVCVLEIFFIFIMIMRNTMSFFIDFCRLYIDLCEKEVTGFCLRSW